MKILRNKEYFELLDEISEYRSKYVRLLNEFREFRKRKEFFVEIKIKELEKENNELKAKLQRAYARIGGLSRGRKK